MKHLTIRDVRVILTAPEGIRLVVVKVETSEPGLYGLGCATFTQRPLAVATAVETYIKPFVVGRDPQDIEDIWQACYLSSYWRNGPVLHNALSGVDMALWDIKGKLAGMPLYQLFGGRARNAAALYAHATGRDAVEVTEQAKALIEQGFRHIRCQVATPGYATYGTYSSTHTNRPQPLGVGQGAWEPGPYSRIVPRLFEHLRAMLGEEIELLHDIHERVPPIDAVRLACDLEPYRLFFLEDPFAPEDADWFRVLRTRSSIPLAMGELFVSQQEYVPLVRERLIDFMRVHLSAIGGLTPARKLAALCEFFGVRTAWHGPGDVSPVGHAANLHLDIAVPNFGIQECYQFSEISRAVFPGTPEIRDGALWPNDSPGLGVDIDEALAARFPYPDDPLNGSWPELRRLDGAVTRP
ncbi:MAG: starvation-sensing protein RspA [Chloroflexi bacterium]|nr:MAG: starvation-sensing protein RspA [Chloroflexota bacterium]